MSEIFVVTARKLDRKAACEGDYREACRLITSREELSFILMDLQVEDPNCLYRYVVEVL